MQKYFNEADLRALPKGPRVHPNGFIQLDLAPDERLHIWTEEPLAVRPDGADIHDHTYDFDSEVLEGALRTIVYEVAPSATGDWKVIETMPYAATGHAGELWDADDARYDLHATEECVISAGGKYFFEKRQFHKSFPVGFTATRMRIHPVDRTLSARLVTPASTPSPPTFYRNCVDPDLLWTEIKKLCVNRLR